MKNILIIGAGRSSSNLIRYLLQKAPAAEWFIRVGDMDIDLAAQKTGNSACGTAFRFDASNENQRKEEIAAADLVISMLPAAMHVNVASDCIDLGKHVITPSYVADEMWSLDQKARSKGVLVLNEMGVDPGIDHMSAMKIIHSVKASGGELKSFESFTGGLIAPESDNNPWNYKITWNPRNVVLAGYGGTARFQQDGELKYIPYHRLFERLTEINVDPLGRFDGYANRDSLKYKRIYGLEDIPTLYRGTLRRSGFCAAWSVLVQLGLTDDSFLLENPSLITWRELTASFVDCQSKGDVERAVRLNQSMSDDTFERLKWLGIFENDLLMIEKGSPAVALQKRIEDKWKLSEDDKDMVVMWHRFRYMLDGKEHEVQSSMITTGEDSSYTAMSKTVGLPIAIAARMILEGKFNLSGIQLPIVPEIYAPVLSELEEYGISFTEQHAVLSR